jgi:DNA-directed RNA polymerase specialized sigma24 family protein
VQDGSVDTGLLVYERDRALLEAFGRLGPRCQRLLRLMMADPPPSYDEIAAALDMPVGSIGPTRGRCLEQLRHLLG